MMKRRLQRLWIATFGLSLICGAEEKPPERPDWAHFFQEARVEIETWNRDQDLNPIADLLLEGS